MPILTISPQMLGCRNRLHNSSQGPELVTLANQSHVPDAKPPDISGDPLPWAQKWRGAVPLLVVLTVGSLASFTAYDLVGEWEKVGQNEHFERLSQEQILGIREEIFSTTAVLRSIRGVFDASQNVDREDFTTFVKSLEVDDHIQALEWIPRVSRQDRASFERAAIADGLTEFQFTERASQGVMTGAGDRQYYFPVYFVEPLAGNETAVGFDLGSNTTRLAALNQARSGGQEVASARITLVQETGEQFGFLIFMPVYAGGSVPDTPARREAELEGFALGVFRMGDLVTSVLSGHDPIRSSGHASELDVFVFDETAPPEDRLLYPKGAEFETREDIAYEMRSVTEIAFAGRTWSIVVVPGANSVFSAFSWTPVLVFAMGLIATGLTALYLNLLLGRTRYADALVEARTRDLVAISDHREAIVLKLKETNKDLESFTYVASHDLKAPLRGIDNLVTWIVEDPDSTLSEDSQANAVRLRTRITRLENLLEGLLEYSRLGQLKADTMPVDAQRLGEEIADYLDPPAGIVVSIGPGLPVIETVESTLQTVLSNLIGNAIKHHDRDHGEVRVSAVDLGDEYRFSVADDGPGIDPSHHQRIFEIFQTLVPRSKVDTSGIGLSIVTRIVAAAGGSIRVDSVAGERGTTFHFTWKKSWPKANRNDADDIS